FSVELCGGTHVNATGDIGLFRITSESGIAAGVRRIEAVTGQDALRYTRGRDFAASSAAASLKTSVAALPESVTRLLEDRKRLEKALDQLRTQLAREKAGDLSSQAREINGFQVVAAQLDADPVALRKEAERLRDSLGSAVIVLASGEGGAVKLVAMVSKDLAGKTVHAGNLIREIAKMVGGGGGGRPDMAQAGGKNPDKIPEALERVYTLVAGA
ncbi:MAG: DHHA1 domain-containing protein, partial [Myxococcota bacterium]